MQSKTVVGAGAFVVLGAALFTAALFMIGERRMLFETRFTAYTELAELGQLETGAIVRVSGMDAGEVTDIQIPSSPAGKFRIRMELREDLRGLIRADSVATPQTEGLVGGIFLNVSGGTEQAPQVEHGGSIPGREPFKLADLLEQASDTIALVTATVDALSGDAQYAVQQIAAIAESSNAMVTEIRPSLTAMARDGSRVAAQAQEILAGINAGEGTVGKLVKDEALYAQFRQMTVEATAVMANVRQVSDDARSAIADFRSKDGAAQGVLSDMRVVIAQAREATADLADNMEAMKRNFLLRGFFNQRGYFDLDDLSPADYRSGVLERDRRKAMRIWLSSPVLFESRPDGSDVLTADGRARIDSAMATYLEYLPANPLVVEGYSTAGSQSERFQAARRRAGLVREYVLERYALSPQHTGSIALGADAPGSPSGDARWDGVSLTLFLDRDNLQFGNQSSPVP